MRILRRSKSSKAIAAARADCANALDALEVHAEQSRSALEQIATQTREIAEDITLRLRADLMDKMREMAFTANLVSDALLICGQDGHIKTMNTAAENLLQCSAETGLRIEAFVHIDTINYWDALETRPESARVSRADGAQIRAAMNVTKMERMDGSVDYIMVIHVPNEDESEIASVMTRGTVMVQDGFITSLNHEMERILEYPNGELLGLPLANIIAHKEQNFVDARLGNTEVETSFETTLVTKQGTHLHCKMAISFINMRGTAIITIESIGEEIADKKVDVLRCFGEDFFFRSSTFIVQGEDMFMYLTPDFTIKYASDTFRQYLSCDSDSLIGLNLRDVLSETEFKIAQLHFESLTIDDPQRTISMHLKNTNSGSHQEWTDRAFYSNTGEITEFRRSGSFR